MLRKDVLLKYVELFFSLIKKLVGKDFETAKFEDLEHDYDAFLKQHFDITIHDISQLDIEQHQHILFDEVHRNYMVLFFLRIAKLYSEKDPNLFQQYLELAKTIQKHNYASTKLVKDKIDKEIECLLKDLE